MSDFKTELTRRYRFSASHRLHSPELTELENAEIYGKCNNPYGHGHDYVLDVTAAGEPHPATGLSLPLAHLDRLVTENVLTLFAYRYINKDVRAFRTQIPTTENVARYIAELLENNWRRYIFNSGARLSRIRLQETDRNSFEILLGTPGRNRVENAARETILTRGH